MITHLTFRALTTCLKICDKIHHGPFVFNKKTGYLEITKNKLRIRYWYFQNISNLLLSVVAKIFIFVQLFSKIPPYGIQLTLLTLAVLVLQWLVFFVNIPSLLKCTSFVNAINSCLQMDRKFKSKKLFVIKYISFQNFFFW